MQREPWEQQGVRSGSEASLKPVPYKLDQRGVTLSASPCVSLASNAACALHVCLVVDHTL